MSEELDATFFLQLYIVHSVFVQCLIHICKKFLSKYNLLPTLTQSFLQVQTCKRLKYFYLLVFYEESDAVVKKKKT